MKTKPVKEVKAAIQKATLTLAKMTTKRVWISCYSKYHCNIIIFTQDPNNFKGSQTRSKQYNIPFNPSIIAGTMSAASAQRHFPSIDWTPLIKDDEVLYEKVNVVIEAEITAVWDGNFLEGIDFNVDQLNHH